MQSGSDIFRLAGISRLILVVLLLSVIYQVTGAQEAPKVPMRVKKGSYVYLNDSLRIFNHDTLIFVSNSMIPDDPESISRTRVFYDSLKVKASRSGLGRRLYDIAIVLPPDQSNQDIRTSINTDYERYNGKTIRKISFARLEPFGTNINYPDTSLAKGFSKVLNKTHTVTKEHILRSYIFLKEGEKYNSFLASESERILRKLKFIDDARLLVIPISEDEIDIHIITRDVYSLGLYYEIKGLKSGDIQLFERSMFGLGHDLTISLPYNYYRDYYGLGYGISYKVSNVARSYINAELEYSNALGQEFYKASIDRPFITATSKYAGGFSIRETFTSEDLDTLEVREPVEYNFLDTWVGRSFLIDSSNMTRLVIAARYINNNVYTRPEITSSSYYALQRYKLYLTSVSLVSQKFYKSNLLYNFGRTEDLPYGGKLDIVYGKEFNEFSKRNYFALSASTAVLTEKAGYFYGSVDVGAFSNEFITEQGIFDFKLNHISNLTSKGRYRFRTFLNLRYTSGFYRFDDEYLKVNNSFGVRGFYNDSIRPKQRFILNLETVAFSPHYLYGFRFVFFAFSDLALISKDNTFSPSNDLIAELGIGVRLRNDNLILKTIQLRFSIFPFSPPYSSLNNFDITGEKQLEPPGFDPVEPSIIRYR
jgi:hypothetical protein